MPFLRVFHGDARVGAGWTQTSSSNGSRSESAFRDADTYFLRQQPLLSFEVLMQEWEDVESSLMLKALGCGKSYPVLPY